MQWVYSQGVRMVDVCCKSLLESFFWLLPDRFYQTIRGKLRSSPMQLELQEYYITGSAIWYIHIYFIAWKQRSFTEWECSRFLSPPISSNFLPVAAIPQILPCMQQHFHFRPLSRDPPSSQLRFASTFLSSTHPCCLVKQAHMQLHINMKVGLR